MSGDNEHFTYCYGQLKHQQLMLECSARMEKYNAAFLRNMVNYSDKIVMDVGAGTGILSLFALQAGAKKVISVEASRMADYAKRLVQANGYENKCEVIQKKVENVCTEGHQVDVIVSEPIGFLLVHERMLESFVAARDKFLSPSKISRSSMVPNSATVHATLFTDPKLHGEQMNRASLWDSKNFYGVDLSCLKDDAEKENFSQVFIGNVDVDSLLSDQVSSHFIDFTSVSINEIQSFEMPLSVKVNKTGILHGLVCWFDVELVGGNLRKVGYVFLR